MSARDDGGRAFPLYRGPGDILNTSGMTLRDWFAGQALPLCTGVAHTFELSDWFGPHASNITRAQIIAKQASDIADAMLAERSKR